MKFKGFNASPLELLLLREFSFCLRSVGILLPPTSTPIVTNFFLPSSPFQKMDRETCVPSMKYALPLTLKKRYSFMSLSAKTDIIERYPS